MQFFAEIIPLFDASVYLSRRFSKRRTSDFINNLLKDRTDLSDRCRTCFQKIVELEAELDTLIGPDPLLEHYFKPIKTKNAQPDDVPLSLGGMLLAISPEVKRPYGFEDIFNFFFNASQPERLCLFYEVLFPFFTDEREKDYSMGGFVSAVNDIIADTEDKWAVIDCASNPIAHLEKLRPLVMKTIALIEERSGVFTDFITEEINEFCAKNNFERRLDYFSGSALNPKNFSEAEIYISLFDFNRINLASSNNSQSFQRFIIGVYLNTLYKLKISTMDPAEHINLLKLLSDPTRFKILHDLCSRQSYGQELADRFGGARSAMYYHLEKLFGIGLLEMEMTEYRNLYTMNKQAVYDKMNAIRDYLLDGWKPEPKQEKEEKEE